MSEAFWAEFELDPRHPSFAPLRASDRDRELVNRVLTEGYAQGRLDREELDTRAATLAAARTLGELPPLVNDLVPVSPSASHGTRALARRSCTRARSRAGSARGGTRSGPSCPPP